MIKPPTHHHLRQVVSLRRRLLTSMDTSKHYVAHATSSYKEASLYSSEQYTTYLSIVRNTFGIHPRQNQHQTDSQGRRLLDIGGGTGKFTKLLISQTDVDKAVVVDPFLVASENNPSDDSDEQITLVKAYAESFILSSPEILDVSENTHKTMFWKENNDFCLIKEAVHHFPPSHRRDIFHGIYHALLPSSLPSSPSILIVTRPKRDVNYPFWPAALEVWIKDQESSEKVMRDLEDAGFKNVEERIETFPCEMKLKTWIGMVKGRFWSTFSRFTDDELDEGCRLIKEELNVDEDDVIKFEDRLVFITGRKL